LTSYSDYIYFHYVPPSYTNYEIGSTSNVGVAAPGPEITLAQLIYPSLTNQPNETENEKTLNETINKTELQNQTKKNMWKKEIYKHRKMIQVPKGAPGGGVVGGWTAEIENAVHKVSGVAGLALLIIAFVLLIKAVAAHGIHGLAI